LSDNNNPGKELFMKKMFLRSLFLAEFVFAAVFLLPGAGYSQTSISNLSVAIVSPTNGQAVLSGGVPVAGIQIIAKATNSVSNAVTNVEFFANARLLGSVTNVIVLDPPGVNGVSGPVYLFTWFGAPPGSNALTAVAMDSQGDFATSPPVDITVKETGAGPIAVRITSPPNDAVFRAPLDIPITAYARAGATPIPTEPSGSVTNVEFYAGTNDLGPGRHLLTGGPVSPLPTPFQFELTWSNPPAGDYPLTAVATDDSGNVATSAVVNIEVLPGIQPTNGQDIVTIVATDPIAIAGTNYWVWHGPNTPTPGWSDWPPTNPIVFTNFGPKDALLTVFRSGSMDSNLDVNYSISGTASNGVDYATLPGTVTIPAGAASAVITIAPISTNPPPEQTVILTLQAPSNTPPGYVVGFPSRAEAIILKSWPLPQPLLLPGGSFNFNALGPDGAWFRADWSSNLLDWTPLCTNQVFDGSINFVDADATNHSRYYRAVPLNGPPE
jgi:hypothetical protein